MDYIRITDDNIEKEHICCAMSGKQGVIKKEWLKQRFKEGLVFCRSTKSALTFLIMPPKGTPLLKHRSTLPVRQKWLLLWKHLSATTPTLKNF